MMTITGALRASRLRFLVARPRGAGRVGAGVARSGVETPPGGAPRLHGRWCRNSKDCPSGSRQAISGRPNQVFLGLGVDFSRRSRLGAPRVRSSAIGDRQIEHVRVAAAHRARLDHEIIKHRVGDGRTSTPLSPSRNRMYLTWWSDS